MDHRFDLISALAERGHVAQIVTHILTLIDNELFLREQLCLVCKQWQRVITGDEILWKRISSRFQQKDALYNSIRLRIASEAQSVPPIVSDDVNYDDDDEDDNRGSAFELHRSTLHITKCAYC